jgi:SAM-dependent methyltransferase
VSERPLFVLDTPQDHHVLDAGAFRFRGAALSLDDRRLQTIEVRCAGEIVGRGGIDLPCPELAGMNRPGAATSRFELAVPIDPEGEYEIRGRHDDGSEVTLFVFAPGRHDRDRLRSVSERIARLPAPSPELVRVTQGGEDVGSYVDSEVAGLFTLETLLRSGGIDPMAIRDVLDIGCGTGRLLAGWHVADPRRRLTGVDIDGELIAWNRQALPAVAEWRRSQVLPPLEFPDASFDLIQLASVFTHLPLTYQRAWIKELGRLLKPGGAALLTLHGEPYARLLLDPRNRSLFEREGYLEVAGADPGANAYSTFHSRAFAEELLTELGTVAFFARGNLEPPSLFPIAALQDAYVVRHTVAAPRSRPD